MERVWRRALASSGEIEQIYVAGVAYGPSSLDDVCNKVSRSAVISFTRNTWIGRFAI